MKKRKYTKEFKLEVLRELEHKTPGQVCREYNVNYTNIHRWKREYSKDPQKAFSGSGNTWKEEAELSKYKRLLGQLYAENEFLKKTLEILQKRMAEERKVGSK